MSLLLLGAGPQVDRVALTGSFAFLIMAGTFTPFTTVLRYNTPGPVGNGFSLGFTANLEIGPEQFVETGAGIQWFYNPGLDQVTTFEGHFPSNFVVIASASLNPLDTVPEQGDPSAVFAGGHG